MPAIGANRSRLHRPPAALKTVSGFPIHRRAATMERIIAITVDGRIRRITPSA
jgi:hypothetical protein